MNENGVITSEKYDRNGGKVEINVKGEAFNLCPGGAEKMRFTWSFDRDASRLFGGGGISASLEAGQVTKSAPCDIGLAARSDLWILPSSGNVTPFSSEERKDIDSDAFYQPSEKRGRVFAYHSDRTTGVFGVELVDRPLFTNTKFAWFEILIGTPAGNLRYVYLYEVSNGKITSDDFTEENSVNLSGKWNCSDGGSYVITQSGNKITWEGTSGDGGRSWTHTFEGEIKGDNITKYFKDHAPGAYRGEGPLIIKIINNNRLEKVSGSNFGGNIWTR